MAVYSGLGNNTLNFNVSTASIVTFGSSNHPGNITFQIEYATICYSFHVFKKKQPRDFLYYLLRAISALLLKTHLCFCQPETMKRQPAFRLNLNQ